MPKRPYVQHDASFRARYRSAPNPLALRRGEWQTFTNIRSADQAIRARWGSTALGSIVSAGTFRGAWIGRFQGAYQIFIAVYVTGSDKTRVYNSTDGGVTWTEITRQFSGGINQTGIGPYSTTRLDDDGLVWFALVQDRDTKCLTYPSASYSQDCLMFGNATSYPRVYGKFYGGNTAAVTNGTGTNQCAIVEPVSAPTNVRNTAVTAKLCSSQFGFALRDAANTNYINSGANYALADVGASATANYGVLTIGTSAASGDTAIFEETLAAKQLLSGKQLHIGVETANLAEFLAKNKIEVGNYSGSFTAAATIWDPTSQATECVQTTIGTNIYLLSFDVEEFTTTSTYDALRFTFKGAAPGSAQTVNIWYVTPGTTPSTANPGSTAWAISHFNAGSHTESPGVILNNVTYPARIEAPGGNEVPDAYTKYGVPASADLFFLYTIPIPNPTQAQIDKGVEAARIYRKRPEDDDYYLVESFELAIYSETPGSPPTSPVWSFTNSTSASQIRKVETLSRDWISRTTPPGRIAGELSILHEAMPKCRAAISANDRVMAGANVTGVPNFLVSQMGQPFRFTFDPIIDPSSGDYVPDAPGALTLQGDVIVAFEQVSGSAVGLVPSTAISTAAVYVFGEQFTYVTGGKTTGQIMSLSNLGIPGTFSPLSISKHRETVYYLDRERQVRKIRGGASDPISYGQVDDTLRDILAANMPYVQGNVFGDRYCLCLRQSTWASGNANRILIWNEGFTDVNGNPAPDWESLDVPPRCVDALLTFLDTSTYTTKQLAFVQNVGASVTLYCCRYDNPSDSLDMGATITNSNANISIAGEGPDIHEEDWSMFQVDRMGIVADSVSAGSVSLTLAFKPDGGTRTKTISLVDGSSYVRRITAMGTTGMTGAQKGGSCVFGFSGSVPGGTGIYQLFSEIEPLNQPFESTPA